MTEYQKWMNFIDSDNMTEERDRILKQVIGEEEFYKNRIKQIVKFKQLKLYL